MSQKRQFKGTGKPYEYYDRKVHHTGSSRLLALGRIIPPDWLFVRVRVRKKEPNHIIIGILRLAGEKDVAQLTNTNQTDKQDA